MIGLSRTPRKNARTFSSVDTAEYGWRQDVGKLVRTKQYVSVRVLGTLTGNSNELAGALRERRIERERGENGYKLLYFGSPHTQYGVGIAISEGFCDANKEVKRFDDRLMKLFTAYAPQA